MKPWTILHLLPDEDFYGPKLVKEVKSLNGDIQRLLDRRAECDKRRDELERADVIEVAALSDDLRSARLDVLQREAQVRRAIDKTEEAVYAATQKARDAAAAAHRQATVEANEVLLAAGWLPESCRWINGMVLDHPRVRSAHDEVERLGRIVGDRVVKRGNAKALEIVEGELNAEREKVLAGA